MLTRGNTIAGGRAGVGILCGVLAAVLGGPAGAGEVRVQGTVVFFKASIGEVNTIVVTHTVSGEPGDPSTVAVKDSTAPIVAISPCTRNGDTVVCVVQGPTLVSLDLNNKNDRASQTAVSTGFSLRMQISGGLGDDTLSGGFNGDTIDGGPGSDQLFGDAGNDTLRSRDGETDALDCGIGNDNVDRDTADSTTRDCRR